MEKTTLEQVKYKDNLTLLNRKSLKVEGITEVISSSETNILVKLPDTILNIVGENIHITKLDIKTEVLELEGLITSIKYGKGDALLKRIFK